MPQSPSIFIVGYGPGISGAVATLFAARGFSLGLISRNPKAPIIPGTKVVTASADGQRPDTVVAALTALKNQLGSPEVVVYNLAGLSLGQKPMMELDAATLEKHMVLGPIGGLQVAQWANEHLEGAKKTVIFTGGGLSKMVYPDLAGLGASKAALLNLANNLNSELKPKGIHVATVTVCGFVGGDDPKYDAQRIAPLYAKLFDQGVEGEVEIVY